MTVHWAWGLSTALLLTIVIWLNGHGIRAGWMLGFTVQIINLAFGWLIYHQWTFLFLLAPALMFLGNWANHPRRQAAPLARCENVDDGSGIRCERIEHIDGTHVGHISADSKGVGILRLWGRIGQAANFPGEGWKSF